MLAKLIKYDLKHYMKFFAPYYLSAIITAFLSRALYLADSAGLINFLAHFLQTVSITLSISTIVASITRIWHHFRRNFYGHEAYLTHTLPITRPTLYFSKIWSSAIVLLFAIFTVLIVLFISILDSFDFGLFTAYFSKNSWTVIGIFCSMLLLVLLEFNNLAQAGFAGIILGHRFHSHHTLASILIGLASYTATSLLILGVILIWGQFDANLNTLLTSGATPVIASDFIQLGLGGITCYLATNIILSSLNLHFLSQGIDVE